VSGLRVGHFTDSRRLTGCTVVTTEDGAAGGVDVCGSAPDTRETDLMQPINLVEKVHTVMLFGGSAPGLAAVTGVIR
jgi:L-aminopeptidase/D-esterase-like protein